MTISTQSIPADTSQNSEFDENFFVNGDLRIAQGGNSFAGIAAGANTYPVDNFQVNNAASAAVLTARQITDHPFLINGQCVETVVTTADAAVGAADRAEAAIKIEGNDVSRFVNDSVAQYTPFCVSFWAKTNIASPVVVATSLQSGGTDRCFPSQFTITITGAWQYFVIPIVSNNFTAGGTWNFNTGNTGLSFGFGLIIGANFTGGTVDAWNAAAASRYAPGGNNICDTVNNYLRIADLKMQRGVMGTAYKRLTMQQQLAQCQRLYWQTFDYGVIPIQNFGTANRRIFYNVQTPAVVSNRVSGIHPVPMRIAPTLTTYNPSAANANWRNITLPADSGVPVTAVDLTSWTVSNPQVAGDAAGAGIAINASFNARM